MEKCEQTWIKSFKSLQHCVKLERGVRERARELQGKGVFTGGGS